MPSTAHALPSCELECEQGEEQEDRSCTLNIFKPPYQPWTTYMD